MDKVKLIYGDDIYYQNHEFEKLDIFREKGESKYNYLIKNTDSSFLRIPHYEEHSQFDFGEEERVYHQYQLH
jgi:hypothetical protein